MVRERLAQQAVDEPGEGISAEHARPLECVQEAGDMLFVPAGWAHSTLNIETSIGVAYEFRHLAGGVSPSM